MNTRFNFMLNADLGEGHDEVDRKVMPFIDQANIACGGHAGNRDSILQTLKLAQSQNVQVGAHPSYADKEHFGRRSLSTDINELEQDLIKQLELMLECCKELETHFSYIKAHGALYNDSNSEPAKMRLLVKLAHRYKCSLMIQSLPEALMHETFASAIKLNVSLILEGFADRAYQSSGLLAPRSKPGAVYTSVEQVYEQALLFAKGEAIQSLDGSHKLALKIDSLCVHGDNQIAFAALKKLHNARS